MASNQARIRKGYKVRPKAIPILTKEQFSFIAKEMERKPSKADSQRLQRAKEIMKHKLV